MLKPMLTGINAMLCPMLLCCCLIKAAAAPLLWPLPAATSNAQLCAQCCHVPRVCAHPVPYWATLFPFPFRGMEKGTFPPPPTWYHVRNPELLRVCVHRLSKAKEICAYVVLRVVPAWYCAQIGRCALTWGTWAHRGPRGKWPLDVAGRGHKCGLCVGFWEGKPQWRPHLFRWPSRLIGAITSTSNEHIQLTPILCKYA